MNQRGLLPLALTQGDPSGIGPEIALKAFFAREAADLPVFFVVGDPALFARAAKSLGLDVGVETTTPTGAAEVFARALPVVALGEAVNGLPGDPDPLDAVLTIRSIERAVEYVAQGRARAVVTNPIAKKCFMGLDLNIRAIPSSWANWRCVISASRRGR